MVPKNNMSIERKFGKLDIKISSSFQKTLCRNISSWIVLMTNEVNNTLKISNCIVIVGEYMIYTLYINTTDNKEPQSDQCVCVLSHSVVSNFL